MVDVELRVVRVHQAAQRRGRVLVRAEAMADQPLEAWSGEHRPDVTGRRDLELVRDLAGRLEHVASRARAASSSACSGGAPSRRAARRG